MHQSRVPEPPPAPLPDPARLRRHLPELMQQFVADASPQRWLPASGPVARAWPLVDLPR